MEKLIRVGLLMVITLLHPGNVASATNTTTCPNGCYCNFQSNTVLTVYCRRESVPGPEQLSRQLDSLLSVDNIVEHLTSLTITDTPLTHVPASICQLLKLTLLNLDKNSLLAFPDYCFTKLTKLVQFSAKDNAIASLQDGLFDGMQRLDSVVLSRNQISHIGLRVFSNSSDLTSLRNVELSYNRLTSLEPWFYYGCILGSDSSRVIVQLQMNLISNFTNNLNFTFRCGMKAPFGSLGLHDNKIRHIMDLLNGWNLDFVSFNCLSNLEGSNRWMIVEFSAVTFHCDCVDFPVYTWVKQFPINDILDGVRCKNPELNGGILRSRPARTVPLEGFICQLTDRCPSNCRCFYRPANATLHVDCSATNLSSLPLHLPPLPKSYARYKLDFSNNKRLRLEHRPYFNKTAVLDVSNCAIDNVNVNIWKEFTRFRSPFITPTVFLQGNKIESLPFQVTSVNLSLISFSLENNPWKCSCENRWMIAWFKSVNFASSNGEDVLCVSPSRLAGRAIPHSSEADFCVDPAANTLKITLSCTLPAVVLLASMLALYCLRVRVYRRFKFHPFDRDECVGEDMDYDVFLCCSSEDNNPHSRRIVELLEENGYRVCFHERDFLPGALITDNMDHAIVHSKRTVCLVTQNFLNSALCVTEFDMAFHHNVALKRTKRLIVLMMLDSPTDLYANDASDTATLRHHVRQYTYIDYTADDWLDKLLYALPLHGLLHRNQDNNEDVQLIRDIQPMAVDENAENIAILN